MKKTKVAILGAGIFGQAIAHLLESAGESGVYQWDKNPAVNTAGLEIEEVLSGAQAVFLCVPTFALPEALENIKKYAPSDCAAVIVSKGMLELNGESLFGAEIATGILSNKRVASLGGPMLATEILESLPTNATLGCDEDSFAKLLPLLTSDTFAIAHNSDSVAVSAAGVLKNIYAIGLGLVEGLGLGANFSGMLIEYAQEEMRDVLQALNLDKYISRRAAGIGDLVATGASNKSGNYSFGLDLAKYGKSERFCEGNASLAILETRLGGFNKFKLLGAIDAIIREQVPAKGTLTKVFLSPSV